MFATKDPLQMKFQSMNSRQKESNLRHKEWDKGRNEECDESGKIINQIKTILSNLSAIDCIKLLHLWH